jgi:arylsulfatase A-like enzyme
MPWSRRGSTGSSLTRRGAASCRSVGRARPAFRRGGGQCPPYNPSGNSLWRALLLALAIAACGCRDGKIHLKLNPDVVRPPRSAIIFMPDGMDLTRFNAMVAAGELPNIQKRFVEGGVGVQAVTGLPSITYPNCTSMITGVYPGHHGIMGNYWFDRDKLETHYYMRFETYRTVNDHFTAPTLYDLLHDELTVNIQDHTRRGVTQTIDNQAEFGAAWFLNYWIYADYYAGMSFRNVGPLANKAKRWPAVVMTYYPAIDEVGHRFGSDSAKYRETLRDLDATVGRIGAAVDEAGLNDSTYFVLVTDHAHVPTHTQHSDLRRFIRDGRGMRLRSDPLSEVDYADRFHTLEKYDVVGGIDQDRAVMFHLRGRRGWAYRPDAREIEEWVHTNPPLQNVPGVRFVVVRGEQQGQSPLVREAGGAAGRDTSLVRESFLPPNRVHVIAHDGSAYVERRYGKAGPEYRLVNEAGDVLRYRADPKLAAFVDAGWHGSREWLAATLNSDNPDFVAQAVEMFDSPHTGDLVVFADEAWSFDPQQHGGHGSCTGGDMRVPMFFSGPDLPKGVMISPGRNVDVMPTIIGLLGHAERLDRVNLDGINLADQLRAAKP